VDEAERADRQLRAFAQLESLREALDAIPSPNVVSLNYVEPFNKALDHLAAIGENVEEFRIPNDWPFNMQGRDRTPNSINRELLYSRVSTVLRYFRFKAAVHERANETGEALRSLVGFEYPEP
jgi:hypothetical protein